MNGIDWTKFDGQPESECACHCDEVFMSHAKTARINGRWCGVSRKPCPKCGRYDNLRRISNPPERFTIEVT